jgi:phosphatidyl-myo-inositol dimannoside synthase
LILFSFDYPPNIGGIARLNAAIAVELDARGIRVCVLTQQCSPGDSPGIDAKVETMRTSCRRPWRELQALLRLIAISPSAVCLSGIWYPEGLLARIAGTRSHIIITLGAELFPPKQRWRRHAWQRLKRWILESADLVVAISDYTASLTRSVAPAANIVTIPLAVNHTFFIPLDSLTSRRKWQITTEFVLCTVSRIHMYKGYDTVLRSLASLPKADRARFTYLIAGKGPDLEQLKRMSVELGVSDQVRWLGFVPDEDLPWLYSASNLFVLMTREIPTEQSVEGFGLVFLEAQACGTPVVGTATGGISDAISHGDGGWLIEQDDVEGLTNILIKLASNSRSFQVMGAKARQRIERDFTWVHYIDRLIAALQSKEISLG